MEFFLYKFLSLYSFTLMIDVRTGRKPLNYLMELSNRIWNFGVMGWFVFVLILRFVVKLRFPQNESIIEFVFLHLYRRMTSNRDLFSYLLKMSDTCHG